MTLSDRMLATGLLQRPEGATVPEIVEGLRAKGVEVSLAGLAQALILDPIFEVAVSDGSLIERDGWFVWVAPGGQG